LQDRRIDLPGRVRLAEQRPDQLPAGYQVGPEQRLRVAVRLVDHAVPFRERLAGRVVHAAVETAVPVFCAGRVPSGPNWSASSDTPKRVSSIAQFKTTVQRSTGGDEAAILEVVAVKGAVMVGGT